MCVLIGSIGFLCYFIYDLNQVKWHGLPLKHFFVYGSILLATSTLYAMFLEGIKINNKVGIIITIVGFCLTIYTLFFALDFEDTYVNEKFKVFDQGMYAMCRHPGVISLAIFYFGLYIWFSSRVFLSMFIVYTILNILYVLFQDVYVFPRLFEGYDTYKKRVPFLVFNRHSFMKGIHYYFGRKKP